MDRLDVCVGAGNVYERLPDLLNKHETFVVVSLKDKTFGLFFHRHHRSIMVVVAESVGC